QILTYTITASNTGNTAATAVQIHDDLRAPTVAGVPEAAGPGYNGAGNPAGGLGFPTVTTTVGTCRVEVLPSGAVAAPATGDTDADGLNDVDCSVGTLAPGASVTV